MLTLYINHPTPIRVKSRFAPGSARAPPPDLAVSCAAVKSEPVPADIDAHLSLLAKAVGREAIETSADETDWK